MAADIGYWREWKKNNPDFPLTVAPCGSWQKKVRVRSRAAALYAVQNCLQTSLRRMHEHFSHGLYIAPPPVLRYGPPDYPRIGALYPAVHGMYAAEQGTNDCYGRTDDDKIDKRVK